MVRTPRVSVVMPSYNHAPFVSKAIESVLAQSFQDFEFIITDDGSTDGTADVVRSYTDSRIDFEVFAQNRGACEAVNSCIARARGDNVAVIASDDVFLPGKLERQVAILDAAPELAAVFGLAEFVDDDGAAVPAEKNAFHGVFSAEPANRFAWLRRFFLKGNALCHSTVMVRKWIYDEIGTYDITLNQLPDFDLWVRICARYAIRVLPEPLIAYRVLSGMRNNSAPSPVVGRRTIWEQGRVLRHYATMDEATLERAFGADIPQSVAERGLPMAVQLAFMAATHGEHGGQLLYALETLEAAVRRGVPGVGPKDLHALTGKLDPFRITELQNMVAQAEESSVARDRLRERAESAERERDEAHARIVQLEQAQTDAAAAQRERDQALVRVAEFERRKESFESQLRDARAALAVERITAQGVREVLQRAEARHLEEARARKRADAQASLQAQLRVEALENSAARAQQYQTDVQELQSRLHELHGLFLDVQRSNSWRLTRPLRLFGLFARSLLKRSSRQAARGTGLPRAYTNGVVNDGSGIHNTLHVLKGTTVKRGDGSNSHN